jgi:hypothetical protein
MFEIENGILGVGRMVILKLLNIIANKLYEKWHNINDEELAWGYYVIPMWYVPDRFRVVVGLCDETYKYKYNWYFHELLNSVDRFDFGYLKPRKEVPYTDSDCIEEL